MKQTLKKCLPERVHYHSFYVSKTEVPHLLMSEANGLCHSDWWAAVSCLLIVAFTSITAVPELHPDSFPLPALIPFLLATRVDSWVWGLCVAVHSMQPLRWAVSEGGDMGPRTALAMQCGRVHACSFSREQENSRRALGECGSLGTVRAVPIEAMALGEWNRQNPVFHLRGIVAWAVRRWSKQSHLKKGNLFLRRENS